MPEFKERNGAIFVTRNLQTKYLFHLDLANSTWKKGVFWM
jgi:hypothetical protein